ncbi:MAG: hypothetical protein ACRDQA_23745 [Nocardioidaceae bacterium]
MIPRERYQPKPDLTERAGTVAGVIVVVAFVVGLVLGMAALVVLAWQAVLS